MTIFEFAETPDRIIHEPARLKIMSVLSVVDCADFTYLLGETGLTRGNLSVQLKRLQDVHYIMLERVIVRPYPLTTASLTPEGRKAFKAYRRYLARLLKATS